MNKIRQVVRNTCTAKALKTSGGHLFFEQSKHALLETSDVSLSSYVKKQDTTDTEECRQHVSLSSLKFIRLMHVCAKNKIFMASGQRMSARL